jgi:hypothetical protein
MASTLLGLWCGAASAYAAAPAEKWCSGGYNLTNNQAELVMRPDGPVLRLGDKTENLAAGGAIWEEKLIFATIDYAQEGVEYKDQKIVIYQDRVFWPCEAQ